jgi:poly [ADP-ribose] polymerase
VANVIEEAKSGRASCRTCRKAIGKGELRFGEEAANAFGDQPSMRWHHLACAAQKLPAELKETLEKYPGEVPERAELEKKMSEALAGGHAKPGGFPYADKAPTGRARCLQCQTAIDKDTLRVAIEREIDTGAMVTRGAGYLHPKCVGAYVEATAGDKAALVAGVRANARLVAEDLETVLREIG